MIVCSFSGPAAELKGRDRTPEKLIAALRRNPRVSCFDMSEKKWLRDMISMLEANGTLYDDRKEPYPWIRYIVTTPEPPMPTNTPRTIAELVEKWRAELRELRADSAVAHKYEATAYALEACADELQALATANGAEVGLPELPADCLRFFGCGPVPHNTPLYTAAQLRAYGEACRGEWRPIAEAPRGVEVLVWRKDSGAFIAKFTTPCGIPMSEAELDACDFPEDFEEWYSDAYGWQEGSERPTLWQPLPGDPIDAAMNAGEKG